MPPGGYTGVLLDIDLTRERAATVPLSTEILRTYLGGRGLAVRLLWDSLIDPHVAATDPAVPVVFAAGPLCGLPVPGASRTAVVTKSPATAPLSGVSGAATLAVGQLPGHFATEMKYAGYDAIRIRGHSRKPVALVIRDGDVQFLAATDLWGQEIPEAESALRRQLPPEPFQVVAIGPAGESGSPLATLVHSHPYGAHAGRGGVGAVLGAKNLKAIALRGTLQPFDVADAQRFDELSRQAVANLRTWPQFETWRRYGTACLVEAGSDAGILAVRNFREGTLTEAPAIGAVRAESSLWVRSEACYYCPLHCRKVALVKTAGGANTAVAGPELETSAMLGANCGLHDLEGILRVKDRCDRLGLDPSSVGNLTGFLMEAAGRGLLLPSNLGGITLAWGEAEAMTAWVDFLGSTRTADQPLARGTRAAARALGDEARAWAMEVKGLEMDTYNVPALPAMVVVYGTGNFGAAHEGGHDPDSQNRRAASDSLGLCRFHTYANPLEFQAELLTAVTGLPTSPAHLLQAGERIWNLERAWNRREGFGPEDDRLPARPKRDAYTLGPSKGAILTDAQEAEILSKYYGQRGWDPQTAAPSDQTLLRLELGDVAETLGKG